MILAAVGVVAALALVAAFVYALADQGDDRVSARWIDQHLRGRRDE